MPNIAIASNDALCKNLKSWFIKHYKCGDENQFENMEDGDHLYIIAHDSEMKNGDEFIQYISRFNYPMTDFEITLIVCSADSYMFSEGLLKPSEAIANHFKRPVLASSTIVTGVWNDDGTAFFSGNFKKINPGDDIISKMNNLNIDDQNN